MKSNSPRSAIFYKTIGISFFELLRAGNCAMAGFAAVIGSGIAYAPVSDGISIFGI
jgi:hypothetical protein